MELKWVWFLRIAAMTVLLVLADACLEHERIALLQLKPFFNYYNDLVDWDEVKDSDCCEWVGIECNTTTRLLKSQHRKVQSWHRKLTKKFGAAIVENGKWVNYNFGP
ncbi:hypothetical protein V6N12_061401 [Hibiscus sabdariffa]|uniref:Leucine-rich repeat-containing N-terminal plant-type domain-containing protein n=1 Tax=Hibiscus sabdariffa TaxID=183260 RepID=A0ABR2DWZ1_9ROSI